ncbi:MAG TPA: porin family protein, partial [Puia sp.]
MNPNRIYRAFSTVLLSFLVSSSLSAQIRLAAWGGVHSSNFLEKNSIPGFDTSNGKYFSPNTGFELGVLAEIPLGKYNLFLQPGILYSSKGNQYQRFYDSTVYQTDTLYNQHTLNLNYVEIPLYVTWKVALSKNQKSLFYLSAGPYFAFIYGATQAYQNRVLQYNSSNYIYQSGTEDLPVGNGPEKYKTYDIGICAKAGFELGNVVIGAYFSRGLTNAYTASYPSSFHNQVFGGS